MRIRTFSIRPPRHPVLRVFALLAAAVVTAGLFVVGLFIGAAVLLAAGGSLLWRRWRREPRPAQDPSIIEGEFTVVSPPRVPLSRAD